MAIDEMTTTMDAFTIAHERCEKTWTEPQVDQTMSLEKRIVWWWEFGERGASSECIWNHMLGLSKSTYYVPSDADDFKRCYKLLLVVPEWREQLEKMKAVSDEWSYLVGCWDRLEELYLQKKYKELNQLINNDK
jgi:hypothetical protein